MHKENSADSTKVFRNHSEQRMKLGTNDQEMVPKCQSTQECGPEPLGNLWVQEKIKSEIKNA